MIFKKSRESRAYIHHRIDWLEQCLNKAEGWLKSVKGDISSLQSKLDKHINEQKLEVRVNRAHFQPVPEAPLMRLDEVDSAGELIPKDDGISFVVWPNGQSIQATKQRDVPIEDVIDAILDHLGLEAYYDSVDTQSVVLYEAEGE